MQTKIISERIKTSKYSIDTENLVHQLEKRVIKTGTEDAIAKVIERRYQSQWRYDHSTKKWMLWNGMHWDKDEIGQFLDLVRAVTAEIGDKRTQRSSFIKGVATLCQNSNTFSVTAKDFDRNNYLLNCHSGTYDLENRKWLNHNQRNLITKLTRKAPKKLGGKRFLRFIDEICCGDKELALFLQVILGSILSGARENHFVYFFIGYGRNGKSVLADLILWLLGDYAKKIPSDLLLKTKHNPHPTEIANLQGTRLALASEIDQNSQLDEAKLKELSGDEILSARFMHGNRFDFQRTHKFLILGNHRPALRSIDTAIKHRIKIIPFNADFSNSADPNLLETLKHEGSFVLDWLIEGHSTWLDLGKNLPPCSKVDEAIDDYLDCQSTPANWMDECLEPSGTYSSVPADLYRNYCQWMKDRLEDPLSQTAWGFEVTRRYPKKRLSQGWRYGAKLKNFQQ